MRGSHSKWWTLFSVGALLSVLAMGWISRALLSLESQKQHAQHLAEESGIMRLALWRMDAWLAPQLAQEAARPYFEYLSFVPSDRAYTRLLNTIEAGEVLSPSPLLAFDSDTFPLHFQLDEANRWSSPQVPTGNYLDLASERHVSEEDLREKRELFVEVQRALSPAGILGGLHCIEGEVRQQIALGEENLWSNQAQQELSKRVQSNVFLQNTLNYRNADGRSLEARNLESDEGDGRREDSGRGWIQSAPKKAQVEPVYSGSVLPASGTGAGQVISVGPLLPIWVEEGAPGPVELYFSRRVEVGSRQLLQGFVVDWGKLRRGLIQEIADLYPEVDVDLVRGKIGDSGQAGEVLATVPARLVVEPRPMPPPGLWTPARVTLAFGWFALIAGLAGFAFALNASIAYGAKRSRFASSVTHELRTPLTTFRMYTEMLARGMVGEEKRQEYLQTLQRESDRLSVLVENVLSYARIEDGRATLPRDPISVTDLVKRCQLPLEQRLVEGEHELEILNQTPEGTRLNTDSGAVEQMLCNLVDNACKYGQRDGKAKITIEIGVEGNRASIQVRDEGPGVPAAVAKAIFQAFDRGGLAPADPRPGIGLGLALCRGLARDLGGELELQRTAGQGACFVLWLPLA